MAQQSSPQVYRPSGNRNYFYPLEIIDMNIVISFFHIMSIRNTSIYSHTLTHLGHNTHKSIHSSVHLLQAPQRIYRPQMKVYNSLSSNGVLCSLWWIMPFLGALFIA